MDCTVHVLVPVPPGATVSPAGLQDRAKSAAAVTVREMLEERTSAPLVPRTWMAYVPGGVAPPADTVSVLAALPSGAGVTAVGSKRHAAPPGSPSQEKSTLAAKPLRDCTVQALAALAP